MEGRNHSDSIRVLTVDLSPNLLRELIEATIDAEEDMEVVAQNVGWESLNDRIDREEANVVVLGLPESSLPEECTELLDRTADLVVLGIVPNGRRFSVFVDNVGTKGLVGMIRAARV